MFVLLNGVRPRAGARGHPIHTGRASTCAEDRDLGGGGGQNTERAKRWTTHFSIQQCHDTHQVAEIGAIDSLRSEVFCHRPPPDTHQLRLRARRGREPRAARQRVGAVVPPVTVERGETSETSRSRRPRGAAMSKSGLARNRVVVVCGENPKIAEAFVAARRRLGAFERRASSQEQILLRAVRVYTCVSSLE